MIIAFTRNKDNLMGKAHIPVNRVDTQGNEMIISDGYISKNCIEIGWYFPVRRFLQGIALLSVHRSATGWVRNYQ